MRILEGQTGPLIILDTTEYQIKTVGTSRPIFEPKRPQDLWRYPEVNIFGKALAIAAGVIPPVVLDVFILAIVDGSGKLTHNPSTYNLILYGSIAATGAIGYKFLTPFVEKNTI